MPHYFIHLLDGPRMAADRRGLTLPDLAAAVAEGKKALRAFAKTLRPDRDPSALAVYIEEERGAAVTFRMTSRFGITKPVPGLNRSPPADRGYFRTVNASTIVTPDIMPR